MTIPGNPLPPGEASSAISATNLTFFKKKSFHDGKKFIADEASLVGEGFWSIADALGQDFPARGARQHLRGCEMVFQFFVLDYCTVILSSSCANCSIYSVFIYSMPSA